MRLGDQIIERASRPFTSVDKDFVQWVPKLRAAQCFEVDASAGQLSQATMQTSPVRASIRTRDSIALPAPLCWFEWRGASAEMGPFANDPTRPGTVVPLRCGVLVEVDESLRRGVMSWVWCLPGSFVEPCPMSIAFDWRPEPAAVPDIVRAAFQFEGLSWDQHVRTVHDSSRFASQEFEPFASEEKRYGHLPCPLMPNFWKAAEALAAIDMRRMQSICTDVLTDLQHEPIFVLGLVICLCAPGLLDVSDLPDVTRLNAARRKRRRTELLPFRSVKAGGRNVIRLSARGGPLEQFQEFHAA